MSFSHFRRLVAAPSRNRLGVPCAVALAVLAIGLSAVPARAASVAVIYHQPSGFEPGDSPINDGPVIFQIRNRTGVEQTYTLSRTRAGITEVLYTPTLAAGANFNSAALNTVAGDVYTIAAATGASMHLTTTNFVSIGLYQPDSSAFFLRNSNDAGPADLVVQYGPEASGWTPVAADWRGRGVDTIGLYDPTTSTFFLKYSNAGGAADLVVSFGPGGAGFVPLGGDWNGDGVDTIGLYDPASGAFFLRNTNEPGPADVAFVFGPGGAGWVPLRGDWDGDGVDTIGLYDPSTGTYFLRNANASGPADEVFGFGPAAAGLSPLAGDWNSDGITTVGLYDPSSGAVFLKNSLSPGDADAVFQFGVGSQTALSGDWNYE
jgi:ribosomal protein S16